MDYKKINGEKVIHELYGLGTILNVDDYIKVEFVSKTALFQKNSFLKRFLKFENKELQEVIEIEIENFEKDLKEKQEKIVLEKKKEQEELYRIKQEKELEEIEANKINKIKKSIKEVVFLENFETYQQVSIAKNLKRNKAFKEAFELYTIAANKGSERVLVDLGEFYQNGIYVTKDNKKAFEYYLLAAEKFESTKGDNYLYSDKIIDSDYAKICYELAEMYYRGRGTNKSITKALEYFNKAIDCYYPDMRCFKSELLFENYLRNIKKYEKSVAKGDIESMITLADLYYRGCMSMDFYSIKSDYKRAFELYNNAAKHNHPEAYLGLAKMYEEGNYVDKNLDKAVKMVKEAIKYGSVNAIYRLGVCYRYGLGVNIDKEKAFELFLQALNKNHFYAKLGVAEMFFLGEGVEKNIKEAYEILYDKSLVEQIEYNEQWFEMMALKVRVSEEYYKLPLRENPDAEEIYDYALTNSNNKLKYLEQAAEMGYSSAYLRLAEIYHKGKIVEKNIEKALSYYKLYCETLNESQKGRILYKIAMIYKDGDGIDKNLPIAIELLEECIKLESVTNAPLELAEMYFNGNGVEKDIDMGIEILLNNIRKQDVKNLIKYLV